MMRAWFLPSWHGDLRLVPDEDDEKKTKLSIMKPTAAEQAVLVEMGPRFVAEGWIKQKTWDAAKGDGGLFGDDEEVLVLDAPIAEVGPVVTKLFRPGDAVITGIKLVNGQIIVCSGNEAELAAVVKDAEKAGTKASEKKPEKAASTKRPTPSCPNCVVGSIEPAREVLLSFLTPEQHATWARDRFIVVEGQLSGNRYRLAHRHTPLAQAQTRICYDLDDRMTVHFHDWSVPPEEEVLAAKLILEHREPWLRNEATMLGGSIDIGWVDTPLWSQGGARTKIRNRLPVLKFKNPFGDGSDGVPDAGMTRAIGAAVLGGISGSLAKAAIDQLKGLAS